MTSQQKSDSHFIIHSAATSTAAIAAGLAQLPLSDTAAITPIQIGMVVAIGEVFDQHVTDSVAKGMVLSLTAGFVGRALTQLLFGWLPGLGNFLNAATAAGLTEAIGWAAADKFSRGAL